MSVTFSPTSDATQPPFPVRPFSVQEYHRLGEAGVITEDDHVELLEGLIVPKMIRNPSHDVTVSLVETALRRRLPDDWVVRVQSAVSTEDSEPEPDVAVVRGPIRRYLEEHPRPADVALVVEVADTSLDRDRLKARIYARAEIPTYWIINLPESRIEVYSEPSTSPASVVSGYNITDVAGIDDVVPLPIEGRRVAEIPGRELLP